MEAFQAYQQDRLDLAVQACQAVLQRNPNQPDALHLQGLVAQRRGALGEALTLIDRALSLGANDSMHSNRGIVLQAMGRYAEAIGAYRRAIELNPNAPAVYCNLGSCFQTQSEWEQANAAFQACLRIAPRNVVALNGLGFSLLMQDKLAEAETALRAATQADARFAGAHTNLGIVLWAKGALEDAMAAYRAALAIDPHQAEVWDRLGVVLGDANRTEEARQAFAKAHELEPNPARKLRSNLTLSHVYESHDDMRAQRQRFEAGVQTLIDSSEQVEAVSTNLFCPAIFNLAYHGDDILPVLRRVAQMYEHLCPSLRQRAPHVDQPREVGKPIRLGFYTAHVFDHPVAHCFAGLVNRLAQDPAFEVLLISYQDLPTGDVRKPYEGFAGRFVKVAKQHGQARQQIADLALDVLAYQDIGMDDLSYFLAFSRLARVQCVMGGHPVTTGLPEMDVYLSSALGEPDDAASHYSERLVALDPGIAPYERPTLPAAWRERVDLGLPAQGNLYVCPMMLQKIHPDFDAAVGRILELDAQGHVVFFAHPNAGWEHALQARLQRHLSESAAKRLHFLPWVKSKDDFAAINHHAAVVLDPFHFGIGSTAITTFAVGTPIVTWPGAFLRGRVGLLYSRLLEMPECVASSQDAYPALAVRIATDSGLRETLRRRIEQHAHRFFDRETFVQSSRAFFLSLAQDLSLPGGARHREMT